MKIGELARSAQCTVETIRYYEKAGLLAEPARTEGNFRVYGPAHLERLRLIRNCRALDMSHEEIHALLQLASASGDGSDCSAVNAVFDQHIAHVDTRLRELTQLRAQLTALRQGCNNNDSNPDAGVDACGILQGLAAMDIAHQPKRHTHLG